MVVVLNESFSPGVLIGVALGWMIFAREKPDKVGTEKPRDPSDPRPVNWEEIEEDN